MSDRYIPDNEPRDILLSLEELAQRKLPHAPTFRKAADEITRLREENARLAALSAKASLEASQLREALQPFARMEDRCLGRHDVDYEYVLISHIRAAAAAIREGGKDEN